MPRAGIVAAALAPRARHPGRAPTGELLAGVTGLTGLALLLGWLFEAPAFRHAPTHRAALSVGLALLTICAGLLAIYPGRGVVAAFSSRSAGGALVRRMLLPALALAIAFGSARLQLARVERAAGASALGPGWCCWRRDRRHARRLDRRYLDSVETAIAARPIGLRGALRERRDPMYVHDLAGRYLAVNRAAEELLGYTRDEICRMTTAEVLAPESANGPPSSWRRCAASVGAGARGRQPGRVRGAPKDGRSHPDRGERARDRGERRAAARRGHRARHLRAPLPRGAGASGTAARRGRPPRRGARTISAATSRRSSATVRPLVQRLDARDPVRGDLDQVEVAAVSASTWCSSSSRSGGAACSSAAWST